MNTHNIRTTLPVANVDRVARRHTRPVMPGIDSTPIIRRNNNPRTAGNIDLYQRMESPRLSPVRNRQPGR